MRKTVIVMAGLLSGCGLPAPPLPVLAMAPTTYRTVSYYDTHLLERDQAKAWCDDNPAAYAGGLAAKYPSCNSASQSSTHSFQHKMGWR